MSGRPSPNHRIVAVKRLLIVFLFVGAAHAQELRFAKIDDLTIGYRTWGQLDEAKSNAILVLTWFGGTSEGLAGWIGPGNLYDPSKYYIIVVGGFGDGGSASPPKFPMRGMGRARH